MFHLKSRVSQSVLAAALAVCVFGAPVQAQEAAAPLFTPVGAWTVGSTEIGNVRGVSTAKMPCVMSNQYDNGFSVRFSGGGSQILAMAVDFRQDVFRQGRKYDAMISVGSSYVKQVTASAFTASTLIFNLRPLTDFYSVAQKSGEMELSIDGNVMRFSLDKLGASYPALESCYGGEKTAPVKPMVQQPAKTAMTPWPAPAVASEPLPKSFNDIVDEKGGAKTPLRTAAAQPRISRTIDENAAGIPAKKWNAKAGEDMKSVLRRWADTAGYDLDWQTAQGGKVAQDIALDGSFENAVTQLLAENAAGAGISGRFDEGNNASAAPAASSSWNAPVGASVQDVLNQWSSKAGVAVVWQNPVGVPVKKAVNVGGSYESAVQALLDQYTNDPIRPVGALNVDPRSGKRTLTMNTDKQG